MIAVILISCSLCHAQTSEEADFAFAKKAFTDGFYALAQENLEGFLEKYPTTERVYEAHLLLGRSFYYQNNPRRSLYEFDIVLNGRASQILDSALYWTANIYYASGDYKKALELYQRIIDEYPASKYLNYALYSKAWSYYRLSFFEDALAVFGEVAARYPLERIASESQFKVGECYYMAGRYEDALVSLNNFVEKYPLSENIAQAYYLMGEIKFCDGLHKESLELINKALSISPAARWSGFAMYRLGTINFHAGNYDESINNFTACLKSVKAGPVMAGSLIGLAADYEKKGMFDEAVKVCDEVTSLFPRTDAAAEGYYIKASVLNGRGRVKAAEDVCLKSIDKFSSAAQTGKLHYELGWIYLKENKAKDALNEFLISARYMKDETFISSALCKIGDIYLESADRDKARANYDAVLKSYAATPFADYAQFRIANLFLDERKYDQAILAYQSILVNFPETKFREKVVWGLGLAYFNNKDFSRALAEFDKLTKMNRESPAYRLYIANSLYNLNSYKEALAIYKTLSDTASQYQIGWCYYKMGQDMDAANYFEAFSKKYPDSVFGSDASRQSAAILLNAAQNFEKWKMPDDAARLYKKIEELKR